MPLVGDSDIVRFKLTPKTVEGDDKQTRIFFTLWHEGAFLAQVGYDVKVVKTTAKGAPLKPGSVKTLRGGRLQSQPLAEGSTGAGPSPSMPPRKRDTQKEPEVMRDPVDDRSAAPKESAAPPVAAPKPLLALNLDREPPDLSVIIFSTDPHGRGESQIVIKTRNNVLRPFHGSFTTPPDLENWLALRFGRLKALSPRSSRPEQGMPAEPPPPKGEASDMMLGLGRKLYDEFAPEIFKNAFWELSKLSQNSDVRFKTIEIITDNPVLPWELMRPSLPDGTGVRGFLGTEFNLGRLPFKRRPLKSPPTFILITKLAVVAPQYLGDDALDAQQDELKALEEFTGFERRKGLRENLKQLVRSPPQGIIHFAGHGVLKWNEQRVASYAIKMEDGELDLDAWGGMAPTESGPNHPLIFFNVCDMGQSQKVVNMVEGWAPAALDAGASGYIGALWAVGDRGAADFSAAFYRTLQEKLQRGPVSIAEVLKETRKKFLENGDPSFLSYIFYGDPNLKVMRARPDPINR